MVDYGLYVQAPFYYAIDHCFPIKGHGTVLTGTVLSGSVSTNSVIEIPELQVDSTLYILHIHTYIHTYIHTHISATCSAYHRYIHTIYIGYSGHSYILHTYILI